MNKQLFEAFGREAAKTIRTESNLNDCRQMLIKVTIDIALNTELDEHLGYEKHIQRPLTVNLMAAPQNNLKQGSSGITVGKSSGF